MRDAVTLRLPDNPTTDKHVESPTVSLSGRGFESLQLHQNPLKRAVSEDFFVSDWIRKTVDSVPTSSDSSTPPARFREPGFIFEASTKTTATMKTLTLILLCFMSIGLTMAQENRPVATGRPLYRDGRLKLDLKPPTDKEVFVSRDRTGAFQERLIE